MQHKKKMLGYAPLTQPCSINFGASIGANVIILPGMTIAEGAMIRAGSVVTRSVPYLSVALHIIIYLIVSWLLFRTYEEERGAHGDWLRRFLSPSSAQSFKRRHYGKNY